MVEFQLERLSPLPITQIVWTVETLSSAPGEPLTAVVTIASRTAVEEFLGTLDTGAGNAGPMSDHCASLLRIG